MMEARKLVCNDCGCRFELVDLKERPPQVREKGEPAKTERGPVDLACPECRSFNVTTA